MTGMGMYRRQNTVYGYGNSIISSVTMSRIPRLLWMEDMTDNETEFLKHVCIHDDQHYP